MKTQQSHYRLFVAVSPGLEPWLISELQELGLTATSAAGGAELHASTEQLWRLHHECRLAEHIRVRLRSFRARHFDELIAGLQRLPWHAYLSASQKVDIHATCHRSRLWHSDAVAERVQTALAQRTRTNASVVELDETSASQSVYVRITGDCVQPAIDASGEPLHRRGRRTFVTAAPLRETLAAALVRVANQASVPSVPRLWDPFCGSGCILFEWAESRLELSAGRDRSFAFERWPIHDAAAYRAWQQERGARVPTEVQALGSDIDGRALDAARANASRYSLERHCTWHCGGFESFADQVPLGTPIVTNPPYGVRLGDRHATVQLMQRFESLLAQRTDLRPAVVLLPHPIRHWKPRLAWESVARFYNGGLQVQIMRLS